MSRVTLHSGVTPVEVLRFMLEHSWCQVSAGRLGGGLTLFFSVCLSLTFKHSAAAVSHEPDEHLRPDPAPAHHRKVRKSANTLSVSVADVSLQQICLCICVCLCVFRALGSVVVLLAVKFGVVSSLSAPVLTHSEAAVTAAKNKGPGRPHVTHTDTRTSYTH